MKRNISHKTTKSGKSAGADVDSPLGTAEPESLTEKDGILSTEKNCMGKKPLWKRILKQVLKTLFIRLPLVIIILLALVLAGLKIWCSPERTESLLKEIFSSVSNGSLELKVREFSPFSGLIFEDIKIYNGPEFDSTLFASIDRLGVKYSIPEMLTGSIHIYEIGIDHPCVYLEEKKGVWNAACLMKSSGKDPEPEPVPEEKKEETSDHISLPVSVDALLHFSLKDLLVKAKGQDLSAGLEGFSVSMDLKVPPVKDIPLSPKAAGLAEVLNVKINPAEKLDLSFYSKEASVAPPVLLSFLLEWQSEGDEGKGFSSRFKCGTGSNPVRIKGSSLTLFNFLVSYNMFYDPAADVLSLGHLKVSFNDKNWLYLAGKISNLTSDPFISIYMKESLIDLKPLYPCYTALTGDRSINFNGLISLYPLKINGTLSDLQADGTLSLRNIYVKMLKAVMDAFVPKMDLVWKASLKGRDGAASLNLDVPHAFYTLKGSRSGDNGLKFSADISAPDMGSRVAVNSMSLKYYYPYTGEDVARLKMNGWLNTSSMTGKVSVTELYGFAGPLNSMLPPRIAGKVSVPLSRPVSLSLESSFCLGSPVMSGDLSMTAKVPDFAVNDLRLGVKAGFNTDRQKLDLDHLILSSRSWNAEITAAGKADLSGDPLRDSDLSLAVSLKAPENRTVYEDVQIRGLVDIRAGMKGDLKTGKIDGSVKIKDLNMNSQSRMISVEKMNLDFPFAYFFRARNGESMLAVEKNQVIDNDFFRQKPNFTVVSVKAKHPARNLSMEYMKDFEAFMAFKNNIFQIQDLKATVLDGSLSGKRILFDIADLNTANMEYLLEMDATNLDINRLDKTDQKKKTGEAELSLNANFSGKGLDINRELSASGYINIHKIGNDFANSLMKGLSETEGKSTLGIAQPVVDNTVTIKSFNFTLNKGLVYTTVKFNRKAIGYLFNIQDDIINFERLTIQEYLRKVGGAGNGSN